MILFDKDRDYKIESLAEFNRLLLCRVGEKWIDSRSRYMPALYCGYSPLARDFNLWYWLEVRKAEVCMLGPFKGFEHKGEEVFYHVDTWITGVIYPQVISRNKRKILAISILCETRLGREVSPIIWQG